jgi:ribosomal protein L37AE/L43A
MSEQTNIEKADVCPFCGKTPTVQRLQSWGCEYKHLVACRTATCPVAPTVIGATLADAIRRWNTRATKTQGE